MSQVERRLAASNEGHMAATHLSPVRTVRTEHGRAMEECGWQHNRVQAGRCDSGVSGQLGNLSEVPMTKERVTS